MVAIKGKGWHVAKINGLDTQGKFLFANGCHKGKGWLVAMGWLIAKS